MFQEKTIQCDVLLCTVAGHKAPTEVRLQNEVITTGKAPGFLPSFYEFLCMSERSQMTDNSTSRQLNNSLFLIFHTLSLIDFIGLPEMAFHNKSLSADK